MGAKTWMLVYADRDRDVREILKSRPPMDRDRSLELVTRLFPKEKLTPFDDVDLSYTNPPDDELFVGCFPGVSIVAAGEFGIDYPSTLPQPFLDAVDGGSIYLHAMHSVVDWFAFAVWKERTLVRALSLSPDSGVLEDIGPRLPFEEPYWSGQHPATDGEEDAYPFPFHPLELGEAALVSFFGYTIEGRLDPSRIDPESIPLLSFKRKRSRWKFW